MSTTVAKTNFAKNIREGDSFDDVFMLESINEKTKRKGGKYWAIQLRDKTGVIHGKIWDEQPLPAVGSFVKIRCDATMYNDNVELNVRLIRCLTDEENVDIADFIPVGPRDRFKQVDDLRNHALAVRHPGLRALCMRVVEDPNMLVAFRDAPAAKSMHHAYVGGLIDHVLGLCSLVSYILYTYEAGARWPGGEIGAALSRDLLISAAIWHDIGKTRELQWSTSINYSQEGNLVGHVVLGLQMLNSNFSVYWDAVIEEYGRIGDTDAMVQSQHVWAHLQHIVASHHGRLEWGAAKTPASREAQIFHLADMIDSRMGAFDMLDEMTIDTNGFGSWAKTTEGPFWRMP